MPLHGAGARAALVVMPSHQADFDSVRSIPVLGGEGRLEPDAGGTRVTFTWQAEVAGSFLSWAVGIARRRVGRLALADLARARDAELKPLP